MIPLWKQLEYYKQYQQKLKSYLGDSVATQRISEALHMMSLGTNDFLENYYALPARRAQFTVQQYEDFLVGIAGNFVKQLYGLGARKVSLGGLPPMGCLPLERTTNFFGGNECMDRYNVVALEFNAKMKNLTAKLNMELPGISLVFSDPYSVLMQIVKTPSQYGNSYASQTYIHKHTHTHIHLYCNLPSWGVVCFE